jgi:hypothetical protein
LLYKRLEDPGLRLRIKAVLDQISNAVKKKKETNKF